MYLCGGSGRTPLLPACLLADALFCFFFGGSFSCHWSQRKLLTEFVLVLFESPVSDRMTNSGVSVRKFISCSSIKFFFEVREFFNQPRWICRHFVVIDMTAPEGFDISWCFKPEEQALVVHALYSTSLVYEVFLKAHLPCQRCAGIRGMCARRRRAVPVARTSDGAAELVARLEHSWRALVAMAAMAAQHSWPAGLLVAVMNNAHTGQVHRRPHAPLRPALTRRC